MANLPPAQNVFNYNPSARRIEPLAGKLTDYYSKNLAGGGITDATRAKWGEMDNATGAAGAQLKQDAVSPGMFGQGSASRAAGAANQSVLQQVAANKLKQAQMAGEASDKAVAGAQVWQGQQNAQADTDRQFAYGAAKDIGDTVTQAGMARTSLGDQGYNYTTYGEQALADQADQAKKDAEWARNAQERQLKMAENESAMSLRQAQDAYDNDPMNMLKRAGSKAGDFIGNIFG